MSTSENQNTAFETSMSMVLTAQRLTHTMDCALSAHGISLSEYLVMRAVLHAPNKRLKNIDIANALSISASGATRMLKPMEKIGLVERKKDSRDARVTLVEITGSGQRVFAEAGQTAMNVASRSCSTLSSDELVQLQVLLHQLP